ncbi:MAG: septal ring lytic transglycosylase RlpA family protein [Enterovibrio sp.]
MKIYILTFLAATCAATAFANNLTATNSSEPLADNSGAASSNTASVNSAPQKAQAKKAEVKKAAAGTKTSKTKPAPAPIGFEQSGLASWYGPRYHGKPTASGEKFNMHAFTAAHRALPFGTKVKIINLKNNQQVTVQINDRGPYSGKRIIDVSQAAAKQLGMLQSGLTKVKITVIEK